MKKEREGQRKMGREKWQRKLGTGTSLAVGREKFRDSA